MQDDDDNDDPMILNIRAKNHTSERTIVPWTVIFTVLMKLKKALRNLETHLVETFSLFSFRAAGFGNY